MPRIGAIGPVEGLWPGPFDPQSTNDRQSGYVWYARSSAAPAQAEAGEERHPPRRLRNRPREAGGGLQLTIGGRELKQPKAVAFGSSRPQGLVVAVPPN